jgi:uncharacterized membrane protein
LLLMLALLGAGGRTFAPIYIERGEIAAYAWLDANAPADSMVLSAFNTGNRLPAYTALRPYVGHGPETLNANAKKDETARFFRNEMSAEERAQLIATYSIRYVFYGAEERALWEREAPQPPGWTDDMTLVYDANGYQVWRVGE